MNTTKLPILVLPLALGGCSLWPTPAPSEGPPGLDASVPVPADGGRDAGHDGAGDSGPAGYDPGDGGTGRYHVDCLFYPLGQSTPITWSVEMVASVTVNVPGSGASPDTIQMVFQMLEAGAPDDTSPVGPTFPGDVMDGGLEGEGGLEGGAGGCVTDAGATDGGVAAAAPIVDGGFLFNVGNTPDLPASANGITMVTFGFDALEFQGVMNGYPSSFCAGVSATTRPSCHQLDTSHNYCLFRLETSQSEMFTPPPNSAFHCP